MSISVARVRRSGTPLFESFRSGCGLGGRLVWWMGSCLTKGYIVIQVVPLKNGNKIVKK